MSRHLTNTERALSGNWWRRQTDTDEFLWPTGRIPLEQIENQLMWEDEIEEYEAKELDITTGKFTL